MMVRHLMRLSMVNFFMVGFFMVMSLKKQDISTKKLRHYFI